MKNQFYYFLIVLFLWQGLVAQSKINQFDAKGRRDGVWEKYYKLNKKLRYTGQFRHGKEIGTFKYYDIKNDETPTVIRKFNANDNIEEDLFYTSKGVLQSKGKMQGKLHIGKWVYYQNDGKSPISEENYNNGKLNGSSKVYYANGKVTEIIHFVNGIKEGNYKRYSALGLLYQDLNYHHGKLNGLATYYERKTGKLLSKGLFKDNQRVGTWRHYKNGEFIGTDQPALKPERLKKRLKLPLKSGK